MKDPLQAEPTPYEVLPSLTRRATRADVDRAFRLGLVQPGADVRKLTAAKQALQRSAERALIDALLYDTDALSDLAPSPLQDPSALELPNRGATASEWEGELRKAFPDGRTAHSLAVLWYWWAVHEEGRLAVLTAAAGGPVKNAGAGRKYALLARAREATGGACDPKERRQCPHGQCQWRDDCVWPAPPVERMWENAIACWAMVISSEEFGDVVGCASELAGALRQSLEERLRNHLRQLAQHYHEAGSAKLAASYRHLELALSAELRVAREMSAAGIRTTRRHKVACGVLMLQRLALLDKILGQLRTALGQRPSDRLKRLQRALLGYAAIDELIERKQYQAALEEAEALPPDKRSSKEAAALRAQALLELGKQHASVGRNQEALDCWGRALREAGKGALQKEIKEAVRSFGEARATALGDRRREEAIDLLERALVLAGGDRLKRTLAELLCQHGIELFLNAQEEARKPKRDGRAVIASMEKALGLLERGVELGSDRARQQAEVAKRILEEEKSGMVELDGDDRDQLRQAREAIGRENWDAAIGILRKLSGRAGAEARAPLQRVLTSALCNRGVGLINKAISSVNAARAGWELEIELFHNAIRRGGGGYLGLAGGCAVCSGHSYPSYTVRLGDGTSGTLCSSCAKKLQDLQARRPNPTARDRAAVRGGQADIAEATVLDPASNHAQECLNWANKVLSDMGLGPLGWLGQWLRRRQQAKSDG